MKRISLVTGLALALLTEPVLADSSIVDAAIGGGLGGVIGAALGSELGGRDGAIIGGSLGAAAGTAYTTRDEGRKRQQHYRSAPRQHRYDGRYQGNRYQGRAGHPHGYFCPPGQAKKGRC